MNEVPPKWIPNYIPTSLSRHFARIHYADVKEATLPELQLLSQQPIVSLTVSMTGSTDEHDVCFKNMKKLKTLNLEVPEVSGPLMQNLSTLPDLEQLILRTGQVDPKSLRHLQNLKNLTSLSLGEFEDGGEVLRAAAKLPRLKFLELHVKTLESDAIAMIGDCPQLITLILSADKSRSQRISQAFVAKFEQQSSLMGVGLSGRGITDEVLACAALAVNLKSFSLNDSVITGKSADQIAKLINLESLNLSHTVIPVEIVKSLSDLSNLNQLDLSNASVPDEVMQHFPAIENLSDLNLSNTSITDESLRKLLHLNNLETFILSNTSITDGALTELSRMPSLRFLEVEGVAGITDASAMALCDLKKLQKLNVRNTGISKVGIQQMINREAIPHILY